MPINDFIQFHFGWLNAWIPSFALVLIQLLYMILYREGGKRAVDTSWYTSKDKRYATLSFVFQGTLLLVSLFVPLRIETVVRGVYRLSRNPMYFFYEVGALAVCIASASLWLLLATIPLILVTHGVILGEERYCMTTYGEDYARYKARTPRYFLLK